MDVVHKEDLERARGHKVRTCAAMGMGCSISKRRVALPYSGVSITMRLAASNTKMKERSCLRHGVRCGGQLRT